MASTEDAYAGLAAAASSSSLTETDSEDGENPIGQFIVVFENGFPEDLCDILEKEIDTEGLKATEPNNDTSYRRCTIVGYPRPDSGEHFPRIKQVFRELFNRYKTEISSTKGEGTLHFCNLLEKPNIIMYRPNESKPEFFHAHSDSWSLDSCSRQISIIVYLNDVEEGGETTFLYGNVKVKPRRGRVLFFPSHFTFTHKGEAPISGPKKIYVAWLHFGNGHSLDPNRKTFYLTEEF